MNHKTSRILAICALIALLLCGCASAGPVEVTNPETGMTEEIYLAENDALSEADRTALDTVLNAFELALTVQDASGLMPYVDESFTATEENLTAFFKSIAEDGSAVHTKQDEYYIRGLTEDTVPIQVKHSEDEENSIQIVPAGSELYVALYTSGSSAPVETMISLMCAKDGGEWRVVWIDISDYLYHGEDATVLYERAKDAYESGNVMPAFLYAQMTSVIASPANTLRYPNTEAIQQFVYLIMSEGLAEYPLPMEIGGVTLRSVATSKTEDGMVPMFFYTTDTPLSNQKALAREAEKVYNAIGEKFPGTIEAFPAAELRMTNQDPETEENFDYETILVNLQ